MTTARKEPRKRTEKKVVAVISKGRWPQLNPCTHYDDLSDVLRPGYPTKYLGAHGLVNISDLDGDVDT